MPNTSISNLTLSLVDLAAADVLPVVQTAGVGPVKMTGLQLAGGLLGSATFNGATITTSQPVLNLSQTWNAGGVTFTGLKFNATDTASASGSLLLDLQVGGASRFNVTKTGRINFATGAGFYTDANAVVTRADDGTASILSRSDFTLIPTASSYRWGDMATFTADLILRRAAAATLQLGAADTAGTSASVTITIATDTSNITWTAHGLTTGNAIQFSASGFPSATGGNINATTTYYVIVVDANTIRIARTYATAVAATPTPVVFTSNGTSVVGRSSTPRQSFRVQSFTGTDVPGQPFVIQGSRGTGNQNGGPIIFQVAPSGSTGSSQNTSSTALTLASDRTLWISGSSTAIIRGTNDYLEFANPSNTAFLFYGSGYSAGNDAFTLDPAAGRVQVRADGGFAWSSQAGYANSTCDVFLNRDTSNTLALRNGTSAQTFNVYNTFTSFGSGTEIWERFRIFAQSNGAVLIGTQKGANGGTARALELQTDGTTRLTIATNGNATFTGQITSPTTNASTVITAPALGAL